VNKTTLFTIPLALGMAAAAAVPAMAGPRPVFLPQGQPQQSSGSILSPQQQPVYYPDDSATYNDGKHCGKGKKGRGYAYGKYKRDSRWLQHQEAREARRQEWEQQNNRVWVPGYWQNSMLSGRRWVEGRWENR
jgi:hypothetical protein